MDDATPRGGTRHTGNRAHHFGRHRPAHAKKNRLKPWQRRHWCFPTVGPDFVYAMEQVLTLYAQPVDPRRPRVCLDEVPVQLLRDPHPPTLPQPGRAARQDYSYDRAGTANLYVLFCPDHGWRHVTVTPRRRGLDFADQLKALVDVHFPEAEQILVVLDNLTAHRPAVLYAAFPPAEACRIAQKLTFVYTPPHASWLNMVEIENSILTDQCLDTRYPDRASLQAAVTAWAAARNAVHAPIEWRFTATDARETLQRLYPKLEEAK